jgi:hypothetical protein
VGRSGSLIVSLLWREAIELYRHLSVLPLRTIPRIPRGLRLIFIRSEFGKIMRIVDEFDWV